MRTIPTSLPYRLTVDPKLNTERRVFETLKRIDFEKDAVALHSLRLAEHDYKREGEIDFVTVGPSGLLVLEVKGGEVYRDAHGLWHFVDRWGHDHIKHEGPFEQAKSGMYALRDALFDHFGSELRALLTYGFGVVAPHANLSVPTAEWAAHEVLDRNGYHSDADLDRFLRKLRDHHRSFKKNPKNLSHKWIERIVEFMRPRFDKAPALVRQIAEAREAQESLTREQYGYLDAAEENDRVLCTGGAGTGKTFLALETARRDAGQGRSVLLTCRSESLAAFLRSHIEGQGPVEVLPALRLETRLTEKYDVLIADEGQDLLTLPILAALDECLKCGLDGGRWRFFYDPNRQSGFYEEVDRAVMDLLLQTSPARIKLTRNCRNPLPIIRQTRAYTGGDLGLPASGEGPDVELLYSKDATDAVGRLQLNLREMLRNGVEARSITILSPRAFAESSAARLSQDLRRNIRPLDVATAGAFPFPTLSFASVVDFKGFENDVVIVTDLDEGTLLPSPENALYVAMSRARVRLVVILPERMRSLMNDLAARYLPALLQSET